MTEPGETSINLTAEDLIQCFDYLLCKLRKGSQSENPTCHLRIFYKVGDLLEAKLIQNTLAHFSNQNIVFTIIPIMHLFNYNTWLSVCGVRHE